MILSKDLEFDRNGTIRRKAAVNQNLNIAPEYRREHFIAPRQQSPQMRSMRFTDRPWYELGTEAKEWSAGVIGLALVLAGAFAWYVL